MASSRFSLLLALVAFIPASAFAQEASVPVLDIEADTPDQTAGTATGGGVESIFRVDNAGGFVFEGTLGEGEILAEGQGERLIWHPYKAAFRAGSIGSGGTFWDNANIGFYSWAGGYNTEAKGLAGFATGYQSSASGSYSTAMGYRGIATGTGSVALGYLTTADASYAVAIGRAASANGYTGAIVFSDASTTNSTEASANNQFTVRAGGGFRLFTNSTQTTGLRMNAGGSSWNTVSDRNRKEDFEALDAEALLQRIARLPLSTYHYIDGEDGVRHVGPMAQDWQRLVAGPLGLNADSTVINQGDFDGVNLAAAQALEARTTEQAAHIAALLAEVAALREEVRQHHPLEQAAGLLGGLGLLAAGFGLAFAARRLRTA